MADALASGASGGYLMVVQIHSAAPLKSICGCGGIGRRARLRILCSQDMQVRVLSTAPVKPCDYYNHRVFSYHFAGIKTEWEIRKHRKQSKNLKKTLLHFAIFSVFIYRGGKGGLKNRHPDDIRSPEKPTQIDI